jgi:stage V sporulation protein G
MKVTRVTVYLTDEDVVRAYVDITLDQCWIIHDVKVIRHCGGYAVAMPCRDWRKGGTYTIAFPTTNAGRAMIEEVVMVEYKKVTANPVPRTTH